jgi:SSS family solute:Na+ symporter
VVMYFVMGAMIFSAYALLGTPQRVISKGSDAFYMLAYGAAAFVPVFYFGARVRRMGARLGLVTQAELIGARYASRRVTTMMGAASLLAFIPYLAIQFKGAGIVMQHALGWPPLLGAALVYAVVATYVMFGGMRGVGWTNVLQGVAMLAVVWWLGVAIPGALFGGVGPMFDRVIAEHPEYLTLPGPPPGTSPFQYSAEIIMSTLGFAMWPQVFMKCFTARSARAVQYAAVTYPSFLVFLVPLLFLGYAALLLPDAPRDESVLLWLVSRPEIGGPWVTAAFCTAVLAASMSTGDALLHGGASIFVRDVLVSGLGLPLSERTQTRLMRGGVVVLFALGLGMLVVASKVSIVDLLLLAYAVPVQFLPPVMLGLYWRRANRVAAEAGLAVGLGAAVALFLAKLVAPQVYAWFNPLDLQIGAVALALNAATMFVLSLTTPPMPQSHLQKFEFRSP